MKICQSPVRRHMRDCAGLVIAFALANGPCPVAQSAPAPAAHEIAPDLSLVPARWAEAAAANQQRMLDLDSQFQLRYRVRRVDDKGEVLREVLESVEGTLARTVQHNGQPLTVEEDRDERERLQDILDHPDSFLRHSRHEDGSRSYASDLLHAMPSAMIWNYAPGQPQLAGAPERAVVLDFKPDPAFHPPSLVAEALTGITGRIWVGAHSHCVLRIQGQILHPINFGWGGVLARLREGGTVEFEQRPVGTRRWLYSHVIEHLRIREVMIHTVSEDVQLDTLDAAPLPSPLHYREAIQRLLSLPVRTR